MHKPVLTLTVTSVTVTSVSVNHGIASGGMNKVLLNDSLVLHEYESITLQQILYIYMIQCSADFSALILKHKLSKTLTQFSKILWRKLVTKG